MKIIKIRDKESGLFLATANLGYDALWHKEGENFRPEHIMQIISLLDSIAKKSKSPLKGIEVVTYELTEDSIETGISYIKKAAKKFKWVAKRLS